MLSFLVSIAIQYLRYFSKKCKDFFNDPILFFENFEMFFNPCAFNFQIIKSLFKDKFNCM